MKKELRVIELFAGIGALRKALMKGGYNYQIVDAIEIDKYAVKSYNAIYGDSIEPQDICEYKPQKKDLGEIDLIMHGSPCQDFSVAGKQAGGDKDSGTRSSLMYETIRIVEELKPKYVIWENVKNLLSKKHRHNFDAYLEIMKSMGYKNYFKVLNSLDYGIPQNRERVFTISILDGEEYEFPVATKLKLKLKDMLEDAETIDEKYYLRRELVDSFIISTHDEKFSFGNICATKQPKQILVVGKADIKGHDCIKRIYSPDGVSPTLTNMQGGHRQPKIAIKSEQDVDVRVRKLTPKECWHLLGFSSEDFEKARAVGTSDTQLYKQAGNSIVVNVLEAILSNLLIEYK